MKHRELVSKIMSEDIISANLTMKFSEVKNMMLDAKMHHMPVVSGKKIIGIISMTDILKTSFSNAFSGSESSNDQSIDHSISLESIMTAGPITIKNNDTVEHAAQILETSDFNSLPVVNTDNELVGIVTTKDLVTYLLKQY